MAVNKHQLTPLWTLAALMAALCLMLLLLTPDVDATCNQCISSHACINETSFQICYNGVRNQSMDFNCPSEKPICTDYAPICMENATAVIRGCGEVSQCSVCKPSASGSYLYSCTSLNTFARCDSNGQLTTGRATCPSNTVCSPANAAADPDNICVSPCDSVEGDVCDRLEEETDDSTTTESPTTGTATTSTGSDSTTSDSSSSGSTVTDTTSTTVNPEITPAKYCADAQTTGYYALPNDTECTSYLYCFYRSNAWQAITYNCTTSKPYFNSNARACGTTKPTLANCTI